MSPRNPAINSFVQHRASRRAGQHAHAPAVLGVGELARRVAPQHRDSERGQRDEAAPGGHALHELGHEADRVGMAVAEVKTGAFRRRSAGTKI